MPIKCPGKVKRRFKTFDAALGWAKAQKCEPPCKKSRAVIAAVGKAATAVVWCKKPR